MSEHWRKTRGELWARRSVWLLVICGVLLLAVTACEPQNDPATSTVPEANQSANEGVLVIPTNTVRPIVSFTPRFTATPIPSATFTPSITPSPTETLVPPTLTPTLTTTPTPTVSGIIQSTESRVNLRSAPSFNSDVVLSVPVGSDLGVIGSQEDDEGLDWYKVAYIDEDGEEYRLWVRANLVATNYDDVVALIPTSTSDSAATAGADSTAETIADAPTRTPGPTPLPERVDILAYCRQKNVLPPQVTTNDRVYVEWSWYVAREDQMQQHLDNANYEVRLDDELLENWSGYATELQLEAGVWIIYWYYPVGRLDAGEHEVTFRLTWDEAITDGYQEFGPGTAREVDTGNCVFSVSEP